MEIQTNKKTPQWQRRIQIIEAIYSDLIYAYNRKNYEERIIDIDKWNNWQKNILNSYFENKNKFLNKISGYLENWTIDRLPIINLAIILEAVSEYEIVKTSFKILIQQSVVTAKKYADSDADYKFINGILDRYFKGL